MFFGLSKNLINFFRNFEIPQIVTINIIPEESSSYGNDPPVQKFICNSVILALHSVKFKRIISAGTDKINIKNYSTPGGVEIVRNCIEFMYGDRAAVARTYDIIGVCKFADVWKIPSLWVAGLNRIKTDLSGDPCKLFEFHQLLSIVTERNLQHEELWREFDKTARENADSLIEHVMGLSVLQDIDDRICKGLIKNSKTAICGQFVTSLIKEGDDSREFVLQNVQLIPIATAFSDETEFLQFKSLFLSWQRGQLASTTAEFYKHHQKNSQIPDDEDKPLSNSILQTDEMMVELHSGSSNNTSKASSITKLSNINVISGRLSTSRVKDLNEVNEHIELPSKEPIKMETLRLKMFSHSRSAERLLKIPLSDYPTLVKGFPLYTGLDIIGHFISESDSLNSRNLMNLLAQFFENRLIPEIFLEDVKTIAILKCSQQGRIPSLMYALQRHTASDRIDTSTMTKVFLDIEEFCARLTQEKNINMQLEEGVPCPIIECDSEEGSHVLHGFYLDFSSESCVNFVSSEDNHQASIIHCYMLGMSENGICFSYIPILQLTIPQIIDRVSSDHVASIRLIIIFSNMKDEESNISEIAVVKGIQSWNTSDDPNDGSSEVPVREDKTKKTDTKKTKAKKTKTKKTKTKKTKTKVNQAGQLIDEIKNFSLYTRLDIVGLRLSSDKHEGQDIFAALVRFFTNPWIPVSILEDLKMIALKSTSTSQLIKKLSIPWVIGRLEAVAVTMTETCAKFCKVLESKKQIKLCSAPFEELVIDMSADSIVEFSCIPSFYRDHIMHCYVMQLDQDGSVLRYISILLLKVSEILEILSHEKGPHAGSVKVVVLLSKSIRVDDDFFKNFLVRRIRYDNFRINKLVSRPCASNDQSSSSTLKISPSSSDKGVINDDDDAVEVTPGSSQVSEKTSSKANVVNEPNVTVGETERTRLLITCMCSVKDYPHKIKELGLHLYSGLEATAHLVSKRNLTDKNLLHLLLPYFKDLAVSVSILEDVRCIALKKCSSQKDSVQKNLRESFDINMDSRVDTFSIEKYHYDLPEFFRQLSIDKRISIKLDHSVLCQICGDQVTMGSANNKETTNLMKTHILQGLEIDLSSDAKVDFIGDEEFHKDHLIHCYIVGLCADKSPISYVSILQLTVREILEQMLKYPLFGVKIVAVFSKNVRGNSSIFNGILV